MPIQYELLFIKSLLITIGIETIVLLIVTRTKSFRSDNPLWIIIFTAVLASFATLPYLWFIFPVFIQNKLTYHLLAELFALGIESFIIMAILRFKLVKSFTLSLSMNLCSYSIGLLLNLA